MIDLDQINSDITERLTAEESERVAPPLVRIWDGDWNLYADVYGEFEHAFKFIRNDAGEAHIDLPLNHYISEWAVDPDGRPTRDMHLTFDKAGARWSGKVRSVRVTWNAKGERVLRLSALHDYQHLKHLVVWANPFLLAEVQIPKSWLLIGPARWAAATTLFVNLLRKNLSLWMLPDDPLDFSQWFDLDMSDWNIVVKPVDLLSDNSTLATISSRFKSYHHCVKDVLDDSQISVEVRRFLPGDPDPIPGQNVKHGALVVEFVDKSGWQQETSFFGNLLTGLERARITIAGDGMEEHVDYVHDPSMPDEYHQPGFMGTRPEAPWVVFEDGPYTGVETTEYEWEAAGPVQFVTGGKSMPGVNEAMSAAVIGLGGLAGSILGQAQVGPMIDAIAEPLYTDTILAFQAHKMHDRIEDAGWDFYFEDFADSPDGAYTISALIGLRKAKFQTRERRNTTVKVNDGAPYRVGQAGFGDFFTSDRVAIHAYGMPENILFVEQVDELEYTFNDNERGWEVTIGSSPERDPLVSAFEKWEETASGLRDLGVI